MRITRLAPSPTGALHLGNARTFLLNWLLARQNGWRIVLRIEDLDGPRIKKGADQQAIEDLKWLGLDWDDGPVYQSNRRELYSNAIQLLIERGHVYPCVCSRAEANLAASAPHAGDGTATYPGTCRGRFKTVEEARRFSGKEPTLRFRAPDTRIAFTDQFAGEKVFNPSRQLGDFVIAKADGTPAYQLSVVVDDAEAGVTDVLRGDDLLDSTPRQILIYRALGLSELVPNYYHVPLVVGPDGRRLAKRHGDTRLSFYRLIGVPPERILALLARWSNGLASGQSEAPRTKSNTGILPVPATSDSPITPQALLSYFDLSNIPRKPITFSDDDDNWLRAGGSLNPDFHL